MDFQYNIKPGRYRHFKGNEYEVLGMAHHSETDGGAGRQDPAALCLHGGVSVW